MMLAPCAASWRKYLFFGLDGLPSRSSPKQARLRPLGSGAAAFPWLSRAKAGGAERNRTAGLLIANEALSQLSYSPNAEKGTYRPCAGRVSRVRGSGVSRRAALP